MIQTVLLSAGIGLTFMVNASVPDYSNIGEISPYSLPRDKTTISHCRDKALSLHPGNVENFQIRSTRSGFHYRFEVKQKNGMKWMIVCDAETTNIIIDQSNDW